MKNNWEWYHTTGMIGLIVGIGIVNWLIPPSQILWSWFLTATAMILFAMLAADGTTGRFWLGWMINEQYRMSLSRLQMFLWTVMILSAYFVAILANINAFHALDAFVIDIPVQLWIAMGISTTALVASPLFITQKKTQKTNKKEAEKTAISLGLINSESTPEEIKEVLEKNFIGQAHRNDSPDDAHLSDLVRGEETSTADILDLTRLQNLFFTFILVGGYAAVLGSHLLDAANKIEVIPITKFPDLNSTFIALLGISHAGYLVAKAIDSQPEGK